MEWTPPDAPTLGPDLLPTPAPGTPAQGKQEKNGGATQPGSTYDSAQTGGSGKPRRHFPRLPRKKEAKEAAKRAGKGTPVHHPNPGRGDPHYHPTDEEGNKIPGPHYGYPR